MASVKTRVGGGTTAAPGDIQAVPSRFGSASPSNRRLSDRAAPAAATIDRGPGGRESTSPQLRPAGTAGTDVPTSRAPRKRGGEEQSRSKRVRPPVLRVMDSVRAKRQETRPTTGASSLALAPRAPLPSPRTTTPPSAGSSRTRATAPSRGSSSNRARAPSPTTQRSSPSPSTRSSSQSRQRATSTQSRSRPTQSRSVGTPKIEERFVGHSLLDRLEDIVGLATLLERPFCPRLAILLERPLLVWLSVLFQLVESRGRPQSVVF